ncbi:MAG: MSCRAMM family protein, partial [bacterium]
MGTSAADTGEPREPVAPRVVPQEPNPQDEINPVQPQPDRPPDETECQVTVEVLKLDSITSSPLAGAKYKLEWWDSSKGSHGDWVEITPQKTTGSSGLVSWSPNKYGKYKVTEVEAPPNYKIADPKSQEQTISSDGTLTFTFYNERKWRVSLTKKDDQGNLLSGAQFTLTGPSYPGGNSKTTGSNGLLVWDDLTKGDYTLAETGVPSGYSPDPGFSKTFKLDSKSGGEKSYSFTAVNTKTTSTPTGTIRVRKIDQNDNPVPNFTFYLEVKNFPSDDWHSLGQFPPTGTDGWTEWTNLPAGGPQSDGPHYRVSEDSSFQLIEISGDWGSGNTGFIKNGSVSIIFKNELQTQTGTVVLNKVFEGATTTATFTLSGPGGYSESKTLSGNGSLSWGNLEWGEYTLSEAVPAGYSVAGLPQTFTVDGSHLSFTFTATNTQEKGTVTLDKVYIGEASSAPVSFTLTSTDNSYSESKTLSGNGSLSWDELAWGEYTLSEAVPAGYSVAGLP